MYHIFQIVQVNLGAKNRGSRPKATPLLTCLLSRISVLFTVLDRESKVGSIPDLLAVGHILRSCGVIAFGELNIDGPDLAVAVRSDGDIGIISVISSGCTRSIGYSNLLGSTVDSDCDRISRNTNCSNADSLYGLGSDNYIKFKAVSPGLAILSLCKMFTFGDAEFDGPDLISKVGTVSADFVALCIVRLDRNSRIDPYECGCSTLSISNLDLAGLAVDLE